MHVCRLVNFILFEPPANAAWRHIPSNSRKEPAMHLKNRIAQRSSLSGLDVRYIPSNAIAHGHCRFSPVSSILTQNRSDILPDTVSAQSGRCLRHRMMVILVGTELVMLQAPL
jgi:hypothetical protein